MKRVLIVCTTDSMILNFLVPHIKELESRGYYVECASSKTGDYFHDLVRIHNVKMNLIPFERSPYKATNYVAYKQLVKLIKEKNFDIVFCHEPVGGVIGRLAGHKCGCKVIYMAHGFHFYKGASKNRKIYYFIEKVLSSYTDILITINKEDYKASLGFHAKENYLIKGIGVDTKKYIQDNRYENYLRKECKLPNDSVIILSVGELIRRKNHIAIIKAISKLNNQNVFYFIAGEGELEADLTKTIVNLGLEERVFLLGYRTDINKLCNAADIFALPSIHEGLSVALMEAMGCGKPIIASRIRGNVDLIDENWGGYLCSTNNVDEYKVAIERLSGSKELRDRFGNYNRKKIFEYDTSIIKQDLIEVIDR